MARLCVDGVGGEGALRLSIERRQTESERCRARPG